MKKINMLFRLRFAWLCDFFWVLQAFLRGKMLRQKAYRLQDSFFRPPVFVSVKRMVMLAHWWGFRPLTVREALSLTIYLDKDGHPRPAPTLRWDGEKWDWGWDEKHRFLTLRK